MSNSKDHYENITSGRTMEDCEVWRWVLRSVLCLHTNWNPDDSLLSMSNSWNFIYMSPSIDPNEFTMTSGQMTW